MVERIMKNKKEGNSANYPHFPIMLVKPENFIPNYQNSGKPAITKEGKYYLAGRHFKEFHADADENIIVCIFERDRYE